VTTIFDTHGSANFIKITYFSLESESATKSKMVSVTILGSWLNIVRLEMILSNRKVMVHAAPSVFWPNADTRAKLENIMKR